MKKIVIVLLIATSIFAQDKCSVVYDLASSIMRDRQINISPVKMMKGAGKNKLVQKIVLDAYDNPSYSTPEIQKEVTKQFATKWYMWCVKALGGK